jgi:hypothetical protein
LLLPEADMGRLPEGCFARLSEPKLPVLVALAMPRECCDEAWPDSAARRRKSVEGVDSMEDFLNIRMEGL